MVDKELGTDFKNCPYPLYIYCMTDIRVFAAAEITTAPLEHHNDVLRELLDKVVRNDGKGKLLRRSQGKKDSA